MSSLTARAARFLFQPRWNPTGSGAPCLITSSWLLPRTYTSNMPLTPRLVIRGTCTEGVAKGQQLGI
jgi:hypothetical protein